MGTPGPTPETTLEAVLEVFERQDEPCTPLTATEVGEELDCTRRTAHRKLEELSEKGELHSKKTGARSRIWWRSLPTKTADGPSRDGRSKDEQSTDAAGTGTTTPVALGEGDQPVLEQFGAFVSAVEDYAIFMLDPDGVVVSWNEGARRIEGYEEEEIVGEHFTVFYDDADVEQDVPAGVLKTAREEGRAEHEGWRVRADGSRFWADVTVTAVRDDDGSLAGYTKVTRDLTERRNYERALEEERDLLNRILDTTPVGILVRDADGDVTHANDGVAEILDITEGEVATHSIPDLSFFDGEGEPMTAEEHPYSEALTTGERVPDRLCQIERPDGERRWLSMNAIPLTNDDGEVERVVTAGDDITELKRRERQLRRERNQTEELLKTAPVSIAVQDADGETVLANRRAQEVLGLSERGIVENPDDADGWSVTDADGTALALDERPTARVLETGEPIYDEELAIERPDGERIWFSINAAPVVGADGEVDRVITTGKEITEHKKRTEELETELSGILGRISDAFYALDGEWRFTHVNDQAEETLQRSADELLGEPIWEEFPEAAEGEIREQYRRAMDTQESGNFEAFYEPLDGWFELSVYPSETGLSVYFRDVTERRERERALEGSEQRYRTLIEHFPNGLVGLFDEDLRYTAAGGELIDEVGIDLKEAIGATIHERFPEDLLAEVEPYFRGALEGEESTFEVEYHDRHLQAHALPVRNGDGEIFAGMLMVQDVTDRAEREIEEQRGRYRRLVDVAPVAIVTYDAEGEIQFANAATAELIDVDDPESLVGTPAIEYIHPDEYEESAGRIRAMLEDRESVPPTERRIVTADDEIKHVLIASIPVTYDGEPAAQTVLVDVTERKGHERELEARARQQDVVAELGQRALENPSLDDLFDEAVEAVADTLDNDYAKVLELQEEDDEMLLRSGVGWREGLVGDATVGIGSDSQAGYTLDSTAPVVVDDLATESRFSGPALLIEHDVSAGISTIIGPPGDPWGVLGTHDTDRAEFTAQDVSFVQSVANILTTVIERARYEQELNETVAELRESNQRLEQFAYIASHDLQEPLRMISNYLQLLEGRYADELDGDARDFIDFAVDGAERMKEMINDLLAYSRVETEAEPLEPVDSETVVSNALDDLRLRIEENDAEIVVSDLPTVVADGNQLEQVFQNLVSNALKYRDEEPPRVEIDAERGDDEWVFRVADNGIGIDPAHVDRIFEVFKRLHTNEEYPGTGIGLALCEKIVERHGGRIRVGSEEGEGATFWFTVPFGGQDDD